MKVPTYCRYVIASKDSYQAQRLEIDGSYLIFRLDPDPAYVKRQQELEQARLKREADSIATVRRIEELARQQQLEAEQARRKHEADSLAAVRRIEEIARQQQLEAEQARRKHEADSLAAVRKAEAKMEAARRKAVADSLAVVREAEKQAEQQRAAEQKALSKAPRVNDVSKTARRYKDRGIVTSFNLAYGFTRHDNWYQYTNEYEFRYDSERTPVSLDCTIGYRLNSNNCISLGAGMIVNSGNSEYTLTGRYLNVHKLLFVSPNIYPFYLNYRLGLNDRKIQPMLSVSGGVYIGPYIFMGDLSFGFNFRMSYGTGLYLMAGISTYPLPKFSTPEVLSGYYDDTQPYVKLGFSF